MAGLMLWGDVCAQIGQTKKTGIGDPLTNSRQSHTFPIWDLQSSQELTKLVDHRWVAIVTLVVVYWMDEWSIGLALDAPMGRNMEQRREILFME